MPFVFVAGVDLFFAARVTDRFEDVANNQWRCGFTYRTLQGHPECGEETFIVEKPEGGGIRPGDAVRFRVSGDARWYVAAEGGGGGNVLVNRPSAGTWETFKFLFVP